MRWFWDYLAQVRQQLRHDFIETYTREFSMPSPFRRGAVGQTQPGDENKFENNTIATAVFVGDGNPVVFVNPGASTEDSYVYNIHVPMELQDNCGFNVSGYLSEVAKCLAVSMTRNRRYGPHNIGSLGARGTFVRLWDKVQRLKTIIWDNVPAPKDETMYDSFLDSANYSIYSMMLEDDLWYLK